MNEVKLKDRTGEEELLIENVSQITDPFDGEAANNNVEDIDEADLRYKELLYAYGLSRGSVAYLSNLTLEETKEIANELVKKARLISSRDPKLRELNELENLTPIQERERLIRQRLSDLRPGLLAIAMMPLVGGLGILKGIIVVTAYAAVHAAFEVDFAIRNKIEARREETAGRAKAVLEESEE